MRLDIQPNSSDFGDGTASRQEKRAPRWLKRANCLGLMIAVGLALWFLIEHRQELGRIWEDSKPSLLFASSCVFAVYVVIQARISVAVLRGLGAEIPTCEATSIFLLSVLGKYVPGKIWIVTLRTGFLRQRGVPAHMVLAGAAIEHTYLFTTALALYVLGHPYVDRLPWLALAAVASTMLLAGITIPQRLLAAASAVFSKLKLQPLTSRLGRRRALTITGCYGGTWLLLGFGLYLLGEGMGMPVSPTQIIDFSGSYGIAVFAGFFALFIPAGLGVREGVFAVTLTTFLPLTEALFFALAIRLASAAAEIAVAIFAWFCEVTFWGTSR